VSNGGLKSGVNRVEKKKVLGGGDPTTHMRRTRGLLLSERRGNFPGGPKRASSLYERGGAKKTGRLSDQRKGEASQGGKVRKELSKRKLPRKGMGEPHLCPTKIQLQPSKGGGKLLGDNGSGGGSF